MPLVLPAVAVILLDQCSKRWVEGHPARQLALGGVLRVHCVVNRDRAYRRAGARAALATMWPAALASAIVLYSTGVFFQGPVSLPGLTIAFAGAASNLADILRRRSIVDFIDVGWWPVFNLADAAIVLGLAAALYP